MQGNGGTDSGQAMHLSSITEFFLSGRSGRRLQELAETGSGVGKPPGRNFDPKFLQ
jgi:hypothetical protein